MLRWQKIEKKNKKAKAEVINWGVMSDFRDEGSVKAIGEQKTVDFLQKVDEKLGSDILRAPFLDTKLTAHQYSQVTPTYPLGCYKCTEMNHTKENCKKDISKKRHASGEIDESARKKGATSISQEN